MIELTPMLAIDWGDLCWILFLAFMALSSIFGKKKKEEEEALEWEELQQQEQSPQLPGARPEPAARTSGVSDLEQELQRLMGGPKQPEPEPPPPLLHREPEEPPPLPAHARVPEPSSSGLLSTAHDVYAEASQLHEHVAVRMKGVDDRVRGHVVDLARQPDLTPRDIADAVAMVRRPDTARQAIIASVILGPPRSLQD